MGDGQGEMDVKESQHTFIEVIEDTNFCALLRLFGREAVTWDAFLEQPLPQNMCPLVAWGALAKIGRCTGVEIPIPDSKGEFAWYSRTYQLNSLIEELTKHAAEGSPLHQVLFSRADRFSVLSLRVEEVVAISLLADITLNESAVERLSREELIPQNAVEQLGKNMLTLDEDLISYVDKPFSAALLNEFYERLVDRVDIHELGEGFVQAGEGVLHSHPLDEKADSLVFLLKYANHEVGEIEDNPLLRGNLLGDDIRRQGFFGSLSGHVGTLAARLYYLKSGFPVMSIIPVTEMKLKWTKEELDFPETLCSVDHYKATMRRVQGDITVYQTLSAQFMIAALRDIEVRADSLIEREGEVREILRMNPDLNHRQRSIVARAARTPYAEFRIRYHQKKHGVSYATARRDMVELVEKGYLRMEQHGKSFLFLPGLRIDEAASPKVS